MKKLLSIVLAVVMLAAFCVSASAAGTTLMPASESDFTIVEGGGASMTITKEGNGFKFACNDNAGWPAAYYMSPESSWELYDSKGDIYLNWDFEVVSGAASVIVYFAGQNPADQAAMGTYVSVNGLIDSKLVDAMGTITDIGVGKYKGSAKIGDLGIDEKFLNDKGEMQITGMKVFAAQGTTIVNELSVGAKAEGSDTVTTGATSDNTTKAATTTAAKTTAKAGTDSAKTADVSNSLLFIAVAVLAGGVVTMTAVSAKKASR